MPDRSSQRGFTLIEVLTAMMILVISLVTIMQLFSGGLRLSWVSGDYTRAVFLAREKMDETLLARKMADKTIFGEADDGYRWRVATKQINNKPEPDEESRENKPPDPLDLFQVTVQITWPSGERERQYEIQTIHIAEKIENKDET